MYEMPYTVQKLLFLLLTYDGVLKVFCKVSAANSYTHCNVSELKTIWLLTATIVDVLE